MSKSKELQICSYDVVFNRTHKVSSIYKYFQQIAREDLDGVGLTYDNLLASNVVFVLAKMKSVFYKPLTSYENIRLETCPRRVKGATFIRDFLITSDGERVGETSSYWALIDVTTRRLCRPSSLGMEFESHDGLCSFEIDDRISFPTDVEISSYKYKVVFSDIDENRHMNNTRYPDVCLDAIGGIGDNFFVSSVKIDYLAEAKLGETLSISFAQKDDTYYFSALNETTGAKCFEAEIEIKEL